MSMPLSFGTSAYAHSSQRMISSMNAIKGRESWRINIGRALTPVELDALRKRTEAASARWMV